MEVLMMEKLLKSVTERSIRYLSRLPEGKVFPSAMAKTDADVEQILAACN